MKVHINDENDSMGSTPKSEGRLQQEPEKTNEVDQRFIIIEQEPVKDELEIKKPHITSKSKKDPKNNFDDSNIKLLGKVSLFAINFHSTKS